MTVTNFTPGGGTVDPRMKNDIGRAFAQLCGVGAMWTAEGPDPLLRDIAHERVPSQLKRQHFVLLRVAFDFYDGSGNITFAEAFRRLDGCMDAYFELSEFIGAVAILPDSMDSWLEQRGISSTGDVRQGGGGESVN